VKVYRTARSTTVQLSTPTLNATIYSVANGRTDRQTHDIMMSIADHTVAVL